MLFIASVNVLKIMLSSGVTRSSQVYGFGNTCQVCGNSVGRYQSCHVIRPQHSAPVPVN